MKRVVISTFCHWTSFGSMLQTYSLQRLLQELGADVDVVLFKSDEDAPAVARRSLSVSMGYIQYLFKRLHSKELEKSREKSLLFIHENINAIMYDSDSSLYCNPPEADVYVAGSDQIWNPLLCKRDVFLSYVPEKRKKISYAASMGTLDIPEKNAEVFSSLIRNFDVISVREKEMIEIIREMTSKSVFHNIDPVFLVSNEEWRKKEKPYPIEGPYILVFPLYWDRNLNSSLRRLHKKTGYTIVSIQNTLRKVYSNRIIYDAGPEEFLWLIDHATGIVTSSFHGTAFSLLFGKRIFPVVNPKSPSRINNILSVLKANRPSSIDELYTYDVNSAEIYSNIVRERNTSIEYFKREIFGNE